MGCANFNPGETAHRSRIFTRVEASCAVAGVGVGGGRKRKKNNKREHMEQMARNLYVTSEPPQVYVCKNIWP